MKSGFDLLVQISRNSPQFTFLVGSTRVIEYANPAALQDVGPAVHGRDMCSIVHPEDWPALQCLLERLTPGEDALVSAIRLQNGRGGWQQLTGRVTHLLSDPTVQALLLQLHPQQDRQRETIGRISRALSSSYTMPDVVDAILTIGIDALGAAAGAIRLLSADGQYLELTGSAGYSDTAAATWGRCSLDAEVPAVRAVLQQQPLFLQNEEFKASYPALHHTHVATFQSAAVLPLMTGDRTIGALSLSFNHNQPFGPEDRSFLTTVADLCAPALDRGRLQRELRQEQDWYHTVTRNSSDIATVMGEDGMIHYESGSVTRILGFSTTELLGQNAFTLIHPDDIALTMKVVQGLEAGVPSQPTMFRFRHRDGHWVWLESIAVDLRQEPHVRGILVNSRDVTSNKEVQEANQRAMRALELSERNFRRLALGSGDLVCQHAVDGRIEYSSPAALDVLGCDSQELLNQQPFARAHPDDQPQLHKAFGQRFSPAFEHEKFEYRVQTGSGSWIWLETSFKALRDAQTREITGFISTTRQIEQRKQAEQMLRAQLDRYQQLLEFTASLEQLRHPVELADEALDKCLSLTEYDYGYAFECHEGEIRMVTRSAHAPALEGTPLGTLPFSERVRQALRRQEACFLGPDDAIFEPAEASPRSHWQSMCLLPISQQSELTTVLVFGTDRSVVTSAGTRQLLGNVAARLSHALDRQYHLRQLNTSREETLRALGLALEYRDYETKGHTDRVVALTERLGQALGFAGADLDALRWGAFLHDTGKVAIPDAILLKPGKLTPEEWEVIKRHPSIGYEMLHHIPSLPPATLDVVLYHQERWNGSGYPCGLAGTQIPLAARVFAVVDVYDALTSERPYKAAWPHEEAAMQLRKEAGVKLDAGVVQTFLTVLEQHNAELAAQGT
ncbi:putative metal dependent phosphohydrolase (plasmid) [Deinococcus deserti VCD115]|uniref:Putative metal dependent phosphohydrolase n=1 Tax=Deinococcus deserti (strain DSM 17065 / CIP 109153 / LMG 22923 / VCD115) TaxID=546414 RepID=C1D2Q1_DEIDV|nr:putative metal dependent phosphohydrolase [Deinococcus deserti VCD115]